MQPTGTELSRKRSTLTPKQGQFAALVARGESLTVAYFESYDTQAGGTSLRVQAWKLSKNPKVAERIEELRAGSLRAQFDNDQLTQRWIVDRLREEATDTDNAAPARIRALELLGKTTGMFTGSTAVAVEPRSAEEIEKEIQAKLAALMPITTA